MPTTEKLQSWQSIHTDYITFAVSSYRAAQDQSTSQSPGVHIDRHFVDTVRYSFDCLESSVEFVYSMGRLRQLPISLPDNWLARYLLRTWRNLSLSDRIGILAYGWAHAIEREIIREEEVEAGAHLKMWRFVGGQKQIGPEAMSFRSQHSLAKFSQNPTSLTRVDAEKSLEILLRHLVRLEDIFFHARTTWFAFFDNRSNSLLSTHDLIQQLKVSFQKVW